MNELNWVNDLPIYVITALLPLSAAMVIFQSNPYHALVIRGILGALAAAVYAILGAADVSLTEALMGTLLAITLYAIAVRSSLVLQLGYLEDPTIVTPPHLLHLDPETHAPDLTQESANAELDPTVVECLANTFKPFYLRIELVPYPSLTALQRALGDREVHAIYVPTFGLSSAPEDSTTPQPNSEKPQLITRVQRLYEIMREKPLSDLATITYQSAHQSANLLANLSTDSSANVTLTQERKPS
jgi:putative multicomponent Na+:H+ antiporter subunit B